MIGSAVCEQLGLTGLKARRCLEDQRYRAYFAARAGLSDLPEEEASPGFRAKFPALQLRQPAVNRPPCLHLGAETGETEDCQSCRGKVRLKLYSCAHPNHGPQVSLKRCGENGGCPGYTWPGAVQNEGWPKIWDHANLFPEIPGRRFNPSILEWGDGYVFAWRDGWKGSNIWLARLTRDLAPIDCRKLELFHKDANYGREDPRLFIFRGRLHCEYIGVVGGRQIRHTNVLYARLRDDFTVERIYSPQLPGRNLWEKNWGMFEHAGELHAVYSIRPHRIIRIDGERCEWLPQTPGLTTWEHGDPRGGASPVLIDGEWYNWFHGRFPEPYYVTGLYTFDAKPPFAVKRFVPHPLALADRATKPDGQWCSTTFVAGAVRREADWVTSSGEHDRWSALRTYPREEIEAALKPHC